MLLALSILPLALTILCGYAVARSGMIPRDQWQSIETLSFKVLIPALIVSAIAGSDAPVAGFGGLVTALLMALALVGLALFGLRLLAGPRLANPQFTSLFQTSMRWNAFVTLAAADQLLRGSFDEIGVAIAVSIPLINVLCILVLAGFGPGKTDARSLARVLARNPLIQASAVGLALKLSGLSLPEPVFATLDLLGRASIGVGLLALGAGISLRRLGRWNTQVALGLLLRPLITPLLFLLCATSVGLDPTQTFVGVLIFASPAATNGFIVARQMGGDAELYIDVLTWQTLLSLLVIPAWAYLLL